MFLMLKKTANTACIFFALKKKKSFILQQRGARNQISMF